MRSPQAHNSTALPRNGYVLSDGLFSSNEGTFHKTITNVAADAQYGTNKQRLTALLAAADSYKSGSNWVGSLAVTDELAPGARQFVLWLSKGDSDLGRTAVLNQANALMGSSSSAPLDTETCRKLWDNLLVYHVAGGNEHLKNGILALLRADNLMQVLLADSNLDNAGTIRNLTNATVVLPDLPWSKFVPEAASTTTPEPEQDPVLTKLLDRGKALADRTKLAKAGAELRAAWEEQRRVLATLSPGYTIVNPDASVTVFPPSEGWEAANAGLGQLDSTQVAALTEETREVLSDLELAAPVNIQTAIDRTEQGAQEAMSRFMKGFSGHKKVVVAKGGAYLFDDEFVNRANTGSTVPPESAPSPSLDDLYEGFYLNAEACRFKPIVVADLRIVREDAYGYKAGEVAHIENVMRSETRGRETRRLLSTEETFSQTIEKIKEEERDTQTTERHQLQQEAASVLSQDSSLNAGLNVTASWGEALTISSNFAYNMNTASEQSSSNAREYAKNVTERAVKRLYERTLTERTVRTRREYEEKNKHEFVNTDGPHVSGVYRWVDKFLLNRIYNYGRRLMFELYVPEPAAVHRWATYVDQGAGVQAIADQILIEKPIDPVNEGVRYAELDLDGVPSIEHAFLRSYADIDEFNYVSFAAAYGATIEAPPATYVYGNSVLHSKGDVDLTDAPLDGSLDIPEGYFPVLANYLFVQDAFGATQADPPDNAATLCIGTYYIVIGPSGIRDTDSGHELRGSIDIDLTTENFDDNWRSGNVSSKLPITVYGDSKFIVAHVLVKFKRNQVAYDNWRRTAYKAIMDAYQLKLEAYNAALASAKAAVEASATGGIGYGAWGENPAMNQEHIRTEIKRCSVHFLNRARMPVLGWNSIFNYNYQVDRSGTPGYAFCDSVKNEPYLRFMETVFDWNNMTYTFFPYFYAAETRWRDLYLTKNSDPNFEAFLKAGYARVLIPVQRGMEAQALHYLRSGEPRMGESMLPDHPLVQAVLDDLNDFYAKMRWVPGSSIADEVVDVSAPWVTKVPTSLVILQPEPSTDPNAPTVDDILPMDPNLADYL